MIRIDINDETLDLDPATTIRLEVQSPLFDFDTIQGTYTFPISIPLTATNKKIFGFVHRLESRNTLQKTYDCKLYLAGKLYMSGLFYTLSATASTISGNIASGPGEFANLIKGKKLADVMSGTIPYTGLGVSAEDSVSGTVDTFSHVFFPVENPDAYGVDTGTLNADYGGIINSWDGSTFRENPFAGTADNEYTICPYIYVVYIIQQIFITHGYTVEGDFLEDAEIRTLTLYNNALMDRLVGDYNLYYTPSNRKRHVPDLLITDFLIALRKMFCITYIFDGRRKNVRIVAMKNLLAKKQYKEFSDSIIPGEYDFTVDPSGYTLKFEIDGTENTTPEYQYKDFSGIDLEYSEGYGTLPASGSEGDLYLEQLANRFYIYDDVSGSFIYYSENSYPLKIGDGANEISTMAMPLMVDNSSVARPIIRNVCQAVQLQSAAGDYEPKPCGMRLTFYRGLYTITGTPRPIATSLDYDDFGNTWNYSLFWNGEKGLKNVWWKDFIEYRMRSKRTKFDVRIRVSDLFNFVTDEKLKYENSRYLPFNLSLTLSMSGENYISGQAILDRL